MWGVPKVVVPRNWWFIMQNPSINGWFGGTPTFGNLHISIDIWKINEICQRLHHNLCICHSCHWKGKPGNPVLVGSSLVISCDLWHLESWSNSGTPWLQLSFRDGKSADPSKLQGERVGEKVSLLGTSLPWVSRNAWRPSAGRKRIPAPLAALFPELFWWHPRRFPRTFLVASESDVRH